MKVKMESEFDISMSDSEIIEPIQQYLYYNGFSYDEKMQYYVKYIVQPKGNHNGIYTYVDLVNDKSDIVVNDYKYYEDDLYLPKQLTVEKLKKFLEKNINDLNIGKYEYSIVFYIISDDKDVVVDSKKSFEEDIDNIEFYNDTLNYCEFWDIAIENEKIEKVKNASFQT